MVKRISSGRQMLREGARVSLSYCPQVQGTIKHLGPEVSDVKLDNNQYRFVCNEFLKPASPKRIRKE